MFWKECFYRPQTKLREGNVFYTCLSVVLFTGIGGLCMMSLPVWIPGPMFLPRGLCLWSHVSSGGSLVFVQGGLPDRDPPGRDPLDKDPLYGKERAVRILLECILVTIVFTEKKNEDHLR